MMRMKMNLSSVFSARNITLIVFILVVLFLGATFQVHVGPESFEELMKNEEEEESFEDLEEEEPFVEGKTRGGGVRANQSSKKKNKKKRN